jgi:hypothetical protein
MGINPEFLADNPEQAILTLQRQRTTKMIVAGATVVGLVVLAIVLMTVAYQDRPGAAQETQQSRGR